MSLQRKFKVTTSITQYMWASSRADAEKFQLELIKKERLRLDRDGKTEAKFCFAGGSNFIEAPEDISKTRDPIAEPRKLDWIEIDAGDTKAVALVTRVSRRKVYYFESISRIERSIDRDRWGDWAKQHSVIASYDEKLPGFIVDEVVDEHKRRGMLSGFNATPDSSLILEVLDKYGYIPDDYEVENGYWAENLLDNVLSEQILAGSTERKKKVAGGEDIDESSDFSISFSEELPSFDEFDR